MSDQPEALFLADVIENDPQSKAHHDAAAAELRRLHALVMDKQGEIYGLTFAREAERKIHGLVKVECGALRARADALQRWHDQQLDRSEKAEAECDALRADAERWKGLFGEALDAFNSRRPTDIEWSAMRDMAREARAALKEAK